MRLSENNSDVQNIECSSKNQWELIVFHVPTLGGRLTSRDYLRWNGRA